MNFRLDIYTWPAMCGINPHVRSSEHQSPAEALIYLEAQNDPYHHAVLLIRATNGWAACDWNGNLVGRDQKWPVKWGTNGHHPDYLALLADWQNLVSEVRKIYNTTGKGTMEIADELLRERYPNVYGWAHDLGWAAAV